MWSNWRCDVGQPHASNASPRPAISARYAPPRSARRVPLPARARQLLFSRLRAGSWSSWCREIDDLASKNRSANMASVTCGRGTWSVLAGLVGNELIEIAMGVVPAGALAAVADHDIFQVAI